VNPLVWSLEIGLFDFVQMISCVAALEGDTNNVFELGIIRHEIAVELLRSCCAEALFLMLRWSFVPI